MPREGCAMAQGDGERKARGRVWTWPTPDLRWPWAFARPLPGFAVPKALHEWLLAEVGAGRLLPWLAVAFGGGIAVYFTAEREPVWWVALGFALIGATTAYFARSRPAAFPLLIGLTAAGAGFATASLKTALIAHPVLRYPTASAIVAGYVEVREERERTDRFVLSVERIEGKRINAKPKRVRLSVRKGTAPAVGAFVEAKARLEPPLQPLRPGGYDFARDLYFQRIGASGFVLGAIKTAQPASTPSLMLRTAAVIQSLRDSIDARIRSVVPGDTGSIASALITGKRDAISTPVNDAMYISSLAHVLSISGYHMAVVAGVVFFVLRAGLALIPGLASRRPIKKWSAFAALVAAALYLALSGAEVATQRSFIMIAIVLVGVMLDRPALTMRTLTVAALLVLALSPEAVVHPSFQMSFAATLALIAVYERGLPWTTAGADTSLGARAALWGGREIVSLIMASLVAGLATTPYAAYHFHRLAPYGVLANLLAMPIVSAWVMPAGLLGLIAIPFGFDGALWRLMAGGIDWMITVATWVANLPGAVGRVHAFGTGPLLVGTAGIIVVCLLKTPLRFAGVIVGLIACLWAISTPRPDVLVAADGRTFAVRGANEQLSIVRTGGDTFATREWLAADGDARQPNDPSIGKGIACDPSGCVGKLANNRVVALSKTADAFEDDCVRAAVIVAQRDAPPDCAAFVVDRKLRLARGALALNRHGTGFVIDAARPPGLDRPWAPAVATHSSGAAQLPTTSRHAPQRDATPRATDLEAGD
jgi:competence protein ComEC